MGGNVDSAPGCYGKELESRHLSKTQNSDISRGVAYKQRWTCLCIVYTILSVNNEDIKLQINLMFTSVLALIKKTIKFSSYI
jgi:hypothetical protein